MRQISSWIRIVRFNPVFCFSLMLLIMFSFDRPALANRSDQLQLIIKKLRENEALYDSIEVHWREDYRKKYYSEVEKAGVPQSSDIVGHWVRQKEMFYLNYEGKRTGPPADARQTGIHIKKGYDGDVTRLLELRHNYVENIIQGPVYDFRGFQPHTIPLRWARTAVPLSVFLSGREAILEDPRGTKGDVVSNLFPTASYVGEETLNGLRCYKISLSHVRNKGTSAERISGRRDFWLAADRNYLPVKTESYNYYYSKVISIESAVLENLQEIQPGIWFPVTSSITVMDGITMREENRPVVSWKREYTVTKVALNPEYAVDVFRNIEFPEDTPVYKVEDGKIVK